MMRLLVPSVTLTLLAVGFQVVLAGFFNGILELSVRSQQQDNTEK